MANPFKGGQSFSRPGYGCSIVSIEPQKEVVPDLPGLSVEFSRAYQCHTGSSEMSERKNPVMKKLVWLDFIACCKAAIMNWITVNIDVEVFFTRKVRLLSLGIE